MENEVIYKITSPNGKVYMGRTQDFMARMNAQKLIKRC
jgi:predicted GIY-YIG superfamily endonuclease